jgi:hypothetical protein
MRSNRHERSHLRINVQPSLAMLSTNEKFYAIVVIEPQLSKLRPNYSNTLLIRFPALPSQAVHTS